MNPEAIPQVEVITATYRRPECLARLIGSLDNTGICYRLWVANNGSEEDVPSYPEDGKRCIVHLPQAENLGCAGGLRAAGEALMKVPTAKYLLVVDDDCVLSPDCLPLLMETLADDAVPFSVPLILDAGGRLDAYPGFLDEGVMRVAKTKPDAAYFLESIQNGMQPIYWATGVCVLARTEVLFAGHLHEPAYFYLGEDLDWTLQLSIGGDGLMNPKAVAHHLPPNPEKPVPEPLMMLKFASLITNIFYLATRTKHGRRLLKKLPGNLWRFLKEHSWTDLARAVWIGLILGERAGEPAFRKWRKEVNALLSS